MAQSLVFFSLDALKHLDGGKAAVAFRRAVEDCVRDCQDRPLEEAARTVTFKVAIKPVAEEDPEFENSYRATGAECEFTITTGLPKRKTKPYSFGIDPQGRMFFSLNSPANVAQTTFDDLDPDTGKAVKSEVREVHEEKDI